MKHLTQGVIALVFLLFLGATEGRAQEEITDEDIKNYAILELAKNSIVGSISPMVNELIEKQEGMTGQRFQELQNGEGEPAKDWETQFLTVVNKQIDKRKKAAGDVVKLLAGNALGAAKYKAVKGAISSDPAIKSKLDAYMASFN